MTNDLAQLGRPVVFFFNETDSTNTAAKRLILEGKISEDAVITCARQTNGRGRRGRSWLDDGGNSLCVTLVKKLGIAEHLERLPLAVALGVYDALSSFSTNLGIKWPNDILCGGKKLSGILVELFDSYALIGVGVNVLNADFPDEIKSIATSLRILGANAPSKDDVLIKLVECVFSSVKAISSDEAFSAALVRYKAVSLTIHKHVCVFGAAGTATGFVKDFDDVGRIIFVDDNGYESIIDVGDVSLREVK